MTGGRRFRKEGAASGAPTIYSEAPKRAAPPCRPAVQRRELRHLCKKHTRPPCFFLPSSSC